MRRELAEIGLSNPWAAIQAVRNFARTVWDPTRSDIQHGINLLIRDALSNAPADAVAQLEAREPEVSKLYAEGYDPALDVAVLERLPDGTLGREYARFIRDNAIDPLQTLLAIGRPRNLLQYHFRRAYKLHDLMHVVLGCDASILGEVRIVSFSLGQAKLGGGRFTPRAPAMALAVLFLHLVLRKPDDFKQAVRLAAEWMRRGEQSPPHVCIRVEDHLDRPVAELRSRMLAAA